ncbi:TauD/TfdA family dioxygenase, partial [Streptomyces wuyuanensis]|uniref:TauD/TfdA family dioxygenase n=1 Tax=Streptomyces wuyuanensis TaxID=1196353 RepID=UPI003D73EE1C
MTSPAPATLPEATCQPGKPPILAIDIPDDTSAWIAAHGSALRSLVAEHGAILVRGLGLRDADQVGAAFRQLGGGTLMPDTEAFAAREKYADGVYSSSAWPPNQPMCMHHELSYALTPPG